MSSKVGDIAAVDDEPRLARAADKGMAAPFIDEWPQKYRTQLGLLVAKLEFVADITPAEK